MSSEDVQVESEVILFFMAVPTIREISKIAIIVYKLDFFV